MIAALDLIAIEFVILAVLCGFLVHHYQSPLVTKDVSFTVYISWVFGFSAVLLLPYDLSLAVVNDSQNQTLVDLWSWVYWSTFFLAWVVLPIQMEYHGSGQFNFKEKLLDALKRLLYAALAAVVMGIVYIIYMVSTSKGSFSQVLGFTMAMGNTYGVLLITILMGSGLVGIPKRLWLMSDIEGELTRLYLIASTVEDAYQEARYELEDCEKEVKAAVEKLEKAGPNSEIAIGAGEYIEILKNKASSFIFAGRASSRLSSPPQTNADYSNKNTLVTLHARLITAQIKARAAEQRWRHLVSECKAYQDSQNTDLSVEDIESGWWCLMPIGGANDTSASSWTRSLVSCYASIYRVWLTKFYSFSCKAAAIVFGVFSCLILWSEMLMASNLKSPFGYFMGAYSANPNPIMIQAVCFLVLAYMSVCTYWTLFRMNIGWSYRLQAPQLSPPSSLIFNAEYLSRLQFALSYNFLLCLNISKSTNAAFSSLMNNIEIVPVFGASFTIYVPIIMIIIALITLFDGFARLLQLIGVESEDALVPTNGICGAFAKKDEMDQALLEKCNNGKMVIANELRQMNIMRDKLKRVRVGGDSSSGRDGLASAENSTHSTTGKSGGNFISALKDTVVKSTTGRAQYANLELAKPSTVVEDDDPDLEDHFDEKKYNRGFVRLDEDDDDDLNAGGSIFSTTLAGNNYSSSNYKSSSGNKVATSQSRPATTSSVNRHTASNYKPTSSSTSNNKQQKPTKSSLFSIEDEEDDGANFRGRYSDF